MISYCARHQILLLGYSPLGVPDYHKFPTPALPANQLEHPDVLSIAAAHGITPAQVLLAWQWSLGIPANPRSMNKQHMMDNLAAYTLGIALNQTEMDTLNTQPQVTCEIDKSWYECDE